MQDISPDFFPNGDILISPIRCNVSTPNNKVQPFQPQSSPVTSNDTTHTPSQSKPRQAVPKDRTQSSQPQPTSNHTTSQPKPELVTFDSKMKEPHHLVKNTMTMDRQ